VEKSGGRRPTLADVAKHAGVSPGTASLALRGARGPSADTAERVRRVADEVGYRPDRAASALAARRTRLLGVSLMIGNSFHAELAEALQDAAEEAGYELLLHQVTPRRGDLAAAEVLLASRCEALLLLGPEVPTAPLAALARRVPVVVLGRRAPGLDAVRADDVAGFALAVDHLVAQGHRELAHVSGGTGDIAAARRAGFLAAVAAHGLAGASRIVEGSFSEESGVVAARALLGDGLPTTAVVAANDRQAVGLLDALARAGVDVPGRISVVGYDDSPLARLAHVRLTSVGQDPVGQAREAVRAALERLDAGRTDPVDVILAPRLVVRATTGPPPT
jgi:DNA-binding LacI/PurR family transcriptional regulator